MSEGEAKQLLINIMNFMSMGNKKTGPLPIHHPSPITHPSKKSGVKNEKKPAVNRNPKKFSRGRYQPKKD